MKKKWGLAAFGLATVAGVVVLGAGIIGGSAQAQETEDEDASWHELYQEALAEKLGVTVEELQAAQEEARAQVIDDAVASGRITEEQAERLRNAESGEIRRGLAHGVKHAFVNAFETAAEILGLTTEEVREGLADGKSLNDLAEEQGVSNLEAQLVAELTADIQAKVADGSITQEQADRLLENLAERVGNLVEHEGGKFRGRFGGFGGFGHGPGGFGPGSPDEVPAEN
jgi:polyhydroxyalkanoate synthesis regulator phasin